MELTEPTGNFSTLIGSPAAISSTAVGYQAYLSNDQPYEQIELRFLHAMDAVALHETAVKWLDGFLQRPDNLADDDSMTGQTASRWVDSFTARPSSGIPGPPRVKLMNWFTNVRDGFTL